jgi:ankyrin repeat protein
MTSACKLNSLLLVVCLFSIAPLAIFSQSPAIGRPKPRKFDPCRVVRSSWPFAERYERMPYGIPLLDAIYNGDVEQVKQLIAGGADVNARTENGESSLYILSAAPNVDIAKLLLESGADAEGSQVPDLETPLMRAVRTKCIDLPRLLIAKGANVNAKNYSGQSPLMLAIEGGNPDAVKLLISNGAEIFHKDANRASAVTQAIRARDPQLVRYLFSLDKNGHYKVDLNEMLIEAIKASSPEMAAFLIDQGADVNGPTEENPGRPLGYAVQIDNLDTVRLLLARGADPNAMKQGGLAVMTCAAIHGNPDIVKILIEAKANVNPPKQPWSPLTEAARGDHIEVMKLLIAAGANLNERAYDGWTPLMMAVSAGKHRPRAVKLLIEAGADVNLQDDDDEKVTALTIARACGWDDLAVMLLEAGAVEQL